MDEVKLQTEDVLSLEIAANENWKLPAWGIQYFYNLDLKNGKKLTLGDLLGQDYKEKSKQQHQAAADGRAGWLPTGILLIYWDAAFNGMDGF